VIGDLSHLEELDLRPEPRDSLTDGALVPLGHLSRLRYLVLSQTPQAEGRITDSGMMYLQQCTCLEELALDNTAVGERGMPWIGGMIALRRIDLSGTRITDGGLERMYRLTDLREIVLRGTAVSREGVARLRAALPACTVHADFS
jgi:hypothetical protein